MYDSQTTVAHQENFLRLSLKAPPMLGKAVGYDGEARFYGLYWSPAGDELVVSDGRTTAVGGNWTAWHVFIHHQVMQLDRPEYRLGNSEEEAEHCLVVDRASQVLYLAPIGNAEAWLQKQWRTRPVASIGAPAFNVPQTPEGDARRRYPDDLEPDIESVTRRMREEIEAVEQLKHWLDRQHRRRRRPSFWLRILPGGRKTT